MEECYELVEEAEMPLSSYTLIHDEALLDATQKEVLINYFKKIEKGIKK